MGREDYRFFLLSFTLDLFLLFFFFCLHSFIHSTNIIMSLPIATVTTVTTTSSPKFPYSHSNSMPNNRRAYLDGLRGFAALLVYILHHQLWAHESQGHIFQNAWGYQDEKYFATLPWIRTLFSGGHYAVSVFFVLSGYVLSNKPLRIIHHCQQLQQQQEQEQEQEKYICVHSEVKQQQQQQQEKEQQHLQGQLANHLASALFRRWIRLHLPLIVTTFVYVLVVHALGIHTESQTITTTTTTTTSLKTELWHWYAEIKNFTFIFRSGGEPWFSYNFHAWSIPIEFRGSVLVFTALLAFFRTRTKRARIFGWISLIFYFLYIVDGWFCALFLGGVLLCDLDNTTTTTTSINATTKNNLYYHIPLLISIYLGGIPSHSSSTEVLQNSPGWGGLATYLKPSAMLDYKWFYLFWASTLLVWTIPRIHWLVRFFESPFNLYLGRISFALYLVHGPVLWTLGDRVYAAVGWRRISHFSVCPGWIDLWPLRKGGPLGLELAFVVPQLLLFPVTLWLAEVVTRVVDDPCVRLSRWLEVVWRGD